MSDYVKVADILTIKIDVRILPYLVQDIAGLIGLPQALKLVDRYKGTCMWVPSEFRPDHELVTIIGADATEKLIVAYGGEKPEMPKCEEAIRLVRNLLIRASDKSQSRLAREWDLTVGQIRNIQNGVEMDDGQEELF